MHRCHIAYIILFSIHISELILSTINYCRSHYSLYFNDENDPEVYLYGLYRINFVEYDQDIEGKGLFLNNISNLGTTGKIKYDCYTGSCKYTYSNLVCNPLDSLDCDYSDENLALSCSKDCRLNQNGNCSPQNCSVNTEYFDSDVKSSICTREELNNETKIFQSCYADNMIFFWKGLYYNGWNASIGYLKGNKYIIRHDEKCDRGYKDCGVLDEDGDKYCIGGRAICPINYITMNESEIKIFSEDYYSVTLSENKTLYYTTEAGEKGKIVGGLYVDSDLALKYVEGCTILDTENITQLLSDHKNRLYKDAIGFDPYKYENIDSKGKSYLKWCPPGFGATTNKIKLRELIKEYDNNITINEHICKIRGVYNGLYFFILGANLILLPLCIISLFVTFEYHNIYSCNMNKNFCDEPQICWLVVLFVMNIPGFIIYCVKMSRFNEIYLEISPDLPWDYAMIDLFKAIDIMDLVLSIFFFITVITIGKNMDKCNCD